MEIYEPENEAPRASRVEEVERCLARGWSWGVTARFCARKWGEEISAPELKRRYAQALRNEARSRAHGEYAAAALDVSDESEG